MKKLIILMVFIFLLCGCSANVNLEVTEKSIDETVTINTANDNTYTKEGWKSAFRDYIPVYSDIVIVDTEPDEKVDGVSYYSKDIKESNGSYTFIYNYNYKFANYSKARSLKYGFKSYSLIKNEKDGTLELSTDSSGFNYFSTYSSLNSINVNIHTDYEVVKNNADSVSNGTYTWNFTPTDNGNIYMLINYNSVSNSEEDDNEENSNDDSNSTIVISNNSEEGQSDFEKFVNKHPILVGIIAVLAFVIFVLIFKSVKIKR